MRRFTTRHLLQHGKELRFLAVEKVGPAGRGDDVARAQAFGDGQTIISNSSGGDCVCDRRTRAIHFPKVLGREDETTCCSSRRARADEDLTTPLLKRQIYWMSQSRKKKSTARCRHLADATCHCRRGNRIASVFTRTHHPFRCLRLPALHLDPMSILAASLMSQCLTSCTFPALWNHRTESTLKSLTNESV